ncbi:hypothetical protein Barb4_02970 [Bacteroidales bacterium Barb4]|nr:hypothetical protein Barb4_02970 [Bacteroidales bacterium Barb4]
MRSAVNNRFVEQNKVLVVTAAAHAEAGRAFRRSLHTRQKLHCLDYIHFAHQCRNSLDRLDGQMFGAHLRLCHMGVPPFRRHDHLRQPVLAQLQPHVQPPVLRNVHRLLLRLIAQIGEHQRISARRKAQRIQPVGIRHGTRACPFHQHAGTDKVFPAAAVRHAPAHRCPPRLRVSPRRRPKQHRCPDNKPHHSFHPPVNAGGREILCARLSCGIWG